MAVTIKSAISSVKWDKFGEHMLRIYTGIYENLQYTDCKLILADGELRASRMVLGMASLFFENIFAATNNQPVAATDPLVVLIPDVAISSMRHVLQFVYTGEVKLRPGDMSSFLDACYLLQIRGLKSNDGRVLGASITDSNPACYAEAVQQVETNYTSVPAAYLMSVVHPKDTESGGTNEAEPKQDGDGSSFGHTVLQSSIVEKAIDKAFLAAQGPVIVTQAAASQYYDVIEEERINEDSSLQGEEEPMDDGQMNQFDAAVNLSCIETLMDQEMEEMRCSNVDTAETADKVSTKEQSQSASYDERLEKAVDAIVNCGVSFRMASLAYNIPKTVLWRRKMKIPHTVKPPPPELPSPRREAIEAIKAGEKLLNVSRRFEIPISTLHRDKIRLYSEGKLPDSVALKQRDKGDNFKQRVGEAAQQCVENSMSLSEAARIYALPKTTIWRKIGSIKGSPECGSGGGSLKRARTRRGGPKHERSEKGTTEDHPNEAVEEGGVSDGWKENQTIEPDRACAATKENVGESMEGSGETREQHMPSNYVFM